MKDISIKWCVAIFSFCQNSFQYVKTYVCSLLISDSRRVFNVNTSIFLWFLSVLPVLVQDHAEVNIDEHKEDKSNECKHNYSPVHLRLQSCRARLHIAVVQILTLFWLHIRAGLHCNLIEIQFAKLIAMWFVWVLSQSIDKGECKHIRDERVEEKLAWKGAITKIHEDKHSGSSNLDCPSEWVEAWMSDLSDAA